ncbi:MAG: manganese efflux pump [Deltaproteobacteria bacterium]|nr:manganese efflux pump [Deltaproteobacteria bacterium]
MPTEKLLGIAVALAMDAFAVAIAVGAGLRIISFRQFFRLSWHFGLFQALMPVLGWAAGLTVRKQIEDYDHWIAFALLALVGCHMIREALADQPESAPRKRDPTRGLSLIMLSVATSIDAFAVGLSLSLLQISIGTPAAVIGLVAGLFTLAGMILGSRIGRLARFSHFGEIIGGVVLLLIGFSILWEHGVFNG